MRDLAHMKERGIIMSGDSVRAIQENRKTQTRRVMKPQPVPMHYLNGREDGRVQWEPLGYEPMLRADFELMARAHAPYAVGDHLYVKEAHRLTRFNRDGEKWVRCEYRYEVGADGGLRGYRYEVEDDGGIREYRWKDIPKDARRRLGRIRTWGKWRSARFMYEFLARLWLEVTGVREERVQEISEEDAIAEGSYLGQCACPEMQRRPRSAVEALWHQTGCHVHGTEFKCLWDSLNAKRGYGWTANPWIFAYDFKRIEK